MSKAAGLIILSLTLSAASEAPKSCQKGEYLDRLNDRCLRCRPKTFQKLPNHTKTDCARCTVANPNNHETEEENCTPEKDTVRGCESGFYISHDVEDHEFYCQLCRKCSENQILIKECEGKSDTVCQNKARFKTTTPKDTTSFHFSRPTEGAHWTNTKTHNDRKTSDDHLHPVASLAIGTALLLLVPLYIVPTIYIADKISG